MSRTSRSGPSCRCRRRRGDSPTDWEGSGGAMGRSRIDELDALIRANWDRDVALSDDPRRLAVKSIDLPQPWVAGAAPTSPDWYTTMFSWDTYFSNLALMVHDRLD